MELPQSSLDKLGIAPASLDTIIAEPTALENTSPDQEKSTILLEQLTEKSAQHFLAALEKLLQSPAILYTLEKSGAEELIAKACSEAKIAVKTHEDLAYIAQFVPDWDKNPSLCTYFNARNTPKAIAHTHSLALVSCSEPTHAYTGHKSGCSSHLAITTLGASHKNSAMHCVAWTWDDAQKPQLSPNGRWLLILNENEKNLELYDLTCEKKQSFMLQTQSQSGIKHFCFSENRIFMRDAKEIVMYEPNDQGGLWDKTICQLYESHIFPHIAKQPALIALDDNTLVLFGGQKDSTTPTKVLWILRPSMGPRWTCSIIELPLSASYYQLHGHKNGTVVAINRDSSSSSVPTGHEHLVIDAHKKVIVGRFSHMSMGNGALSPCGSFVALEDDIEGVYNRADTVSIFSIQNPTKIQKIHTILNAESIIGWPAYIGSPIICSTKRVEKHDGEMGAIPGIISVYPNRVAAILGRFANTKT